MLRIVTPPAESPVTLDEAKAQLQITDSSQDDMIEALIAAATLSAQSQTQRLFVAQQAECVYRGWRVPIEMPVAPIAAADGIVSIKYVDWSTQLQQTLDPSLYVVQTSGPSVRIIPKFGTFWPLVFAHSSEPVVIRFNVGVDPSGDGIAQNVKRAILLTVRHLYSLGEQNIFVKRDSVIGVGDRYMQVDPGAVDLLPNAASLLLLSERWEHPL